MDESRPNISNFVVAGMQAPAVFTAFLVAATFLSGCVLVATWFLKEEVRDKSNEMRDRMKEVTTELRIMQVHIEDQNAILLREGLKKPEDEHKGPTGQAR